jgi:hypothetical protein
MKRHLVASLALICVAGCLQPPGPADSGTTPTTEGSTTPTAAPPNPADILVRGNLHWDGTQYLANLSAYNSGGHAYGYSQPYCVGTPWQAGLSGPPGTGLTYRDPSYASYGCSSMSGRFAPKTWANWTADPSCHRHLICDNQWDGRLWDANGQPSLAPPGNYTWRFSLSYSDIPPTTPNDAPAGDLHTEQIVFVLHIRVSGIQGTASEGPTEPVCRNGEPCSGPYQGPLQATRRDGWTRAFTTDQNGTFDVPLPPGTYTITNPPSYTFPRCSQDVAVLPNQYTTVDIACDTGIR